MIVNLTPSCDNGCDSKRGLNERAKTRKEVREKAGGDADNVAEGAGQTPKEVLSNK